MSDLFSNLALGFHVVFQFVPWSPSWLGGVSIPIPANILLCLIGALVGTLVGVLPGIGTIATVAMLLPITFGLPPVGALIMLAGIYYGAQYGGSTTSILVHIPGEATWGGPRPSGTCDPRDRVVLRGLRLDGADSGTRCPIDKTRAGVRAGRIFLADGA